MAGVKLDLRGLEAVALKMGPAVAKAAEEIAENVRSQGHMVSGIPGDEVLPVTAAVGETSNMRVNRAKAWVNLAHPAGLAVQAKHGALTKAASAAGLEVGGDSGRDMVRYTSSSGRVSTVTRAQALNYGGSFSEL